MKVQTFRCYGGPLDGHEVTEQYAGDDYVRFNSASGEMWPPMVVMTNGTKSFHANTKAWNRKFNLGIKPVVPKCILVYFPDPVVLIYDKGQKRLV
jgi:hypothetical protein